MKKIRIDDEVMVIAGKDKGKTGKILKIDEKANRVLVQGLNLFKKALKATQENPAGGFAEVERPIHRSNVMVVDPKSGKRSRVRISQEAGKNKGRIAVQSGSAL